MLDFRWTILTSKEKPTSAIICLPGRGGHGAELAHFYSRSDLDETVLIGVTPTERQWYPMPFSPTHQEDAVGGLEIARKVIEAVISRVQNQYGLPRERVALTGFSAGGVMSIYTLLHGDSPLAGVVCHAGAILEPENVPACKFPEVPIVLTHNKDDMDFKWDERYLPMANALDENNWNLYAIEGTYGGHGITADDVMYAAFVLSERLGYSDEWRKEHNFYN